MTLKMGLNGKKSKPFAVKIIESSYLRDLVKITIISHFTEYLQAARFQWYRNKWKC
jgi:hypothetical protein